MPKLTVGFAPAVNKTVCGYSKSVFIVVSLSNKCGEGNKNVCSFCKST